MNYINCRKKYKSLNNNGILEVIDTPDKLSIIRKTQSILNDAEKICEILFLYRGENKKLFYEKTGCIVNSGSTNEPKFDRFFVIGSKAKSYLNNKTMNFTSLRQFDHKEKTEYIFHKLHEMSNDCKNSKSLVYFKYSKNKSKFYEGMNNIKNKTHKMIIENFYISFIHTLSSNPIDMKAYSVMISATKKYQKAKEFSDNGYIIGFWLLKPINTQAIDYQILDNYKLIFAKYNLPMINMVNSPDNYEVTIFSAIFPHNIFYVYDIEKQTYIINPYLFDTKLENIIATGINVDQTYFDDSTKGIYERSIWRSGTSLSFEEELDN